LDYVETLVDYVELDKPIARVMDYLRKEKTASRSKVLQYTHINAKQMELAEETLRQRGDIKIDRKTIHRSGRGSIVKKVYTWSGK
jgi:predicted transcriptional regulator